jgi:hypothetical protein
MQTISFPVPKGVKTVNYEYGTLNYRTVYNENKPEELDTVDEILGLN